MSEPTGKKCNVCGEGLVVEEVETPIEVGVPIGQQFIGRGGRRDGKGKIHSTICYCGGCGLLYHPPVVLHKK